MINIKQHPKVEAKFNKFIEKLINVWVEQAVGEGMEENDLSAEYIKSASETMIASNPRLLTDFLDTEGVYGVIDVSSETNWGFRILGEPSQNSYFPSRKLAEEALYLQCFETLESRL